MSLRSIATSSPLLLIAAFVLPFGCGDDEDDEALDCAPSDVCPPGFAYEIGECVEEGCFKLNDECGGVYCKPCNCAEGQAAVPACKPGQECEVAFPCSVEPLCAECDSIACDAGDTPRPSGTCPDDGTPCYTIDCGEGIACVDAFPWRWCPDEEPSVNEPCQTYLAFTPSSGDAACSYPTADDCVHTYLCDEETLRWTRELLCPE